MTSPFADLVGTELGVSEWIETSQEFVNAYATMMGDRGPIHNEPDSDAAKALGGTIVQGTLMIGSIPAMLRDVYWPMEGIQYRLHYGYDKIRFINPVPTGSRFRGRFTLEAAEPRGDGERVRINATIEVEGSDEPAAVAELLAFVKWAT
jgi:acyl dehydratase